MPPVVHEVVLKRRVQNAETELFEWLKCACRITDDDCLVLETVDEEEDDQEETDPTADTSVMIDLSWQLHALEQKRKCKTRCELQYVVVNPETNAKDLFSEELMAPSPRHCLEWIALVRDAEKRAKRRQSIRQGTATATAVAAMHSTLATSSVSSGSRAAEPVAQSTVGSTIDSTPAPLTPFDASVSSVSASVDVTTRTKTPPTQLTKPQRESVLLSQHNRYDDSELDDDELRSAVDAKPTAPAPRASLLAAMRRLLPHDSPRTTPSTNADESEVLTTQWRRASRRHVEDEDEDDRIAYMRSAREPLSVVSPSCTITKHLRHVRSSPSSIVSSVVSPARHVRRPSSATLLSATRRVPLASSSTRRRPPLGRSSGATSAAAVAASIERLRRRDGFREDDDDHEEQGDTREELDILVRVETALRHLERENALAKEREAALAHQVSSLQDALRVRAAEKKHLETYVQQLTRDKDGWKHAAQRAERTLAQLQDELAIAQEETQLQHSERHRLKHQNQELLSQVHRLDSIVYGRF